VTTELPPRPPLDRDRLAALAPAYAVEVVEQVASTNAVVADRAREGAEAGLVVAAEHQTAGRGRLDRTWDTPARAALTFSVLLRPSVPPVRWPWLPLVAGLAFGSGFPAPVGLKWPNDVLVGDRKLAGILVELVDAPAGPAAVVGVGINVTTTTGELPVPEATSLHVEGVHVDRTDLLVGYLRELRRRLDHWQNGTDRLRADYERLCVTLGRQVRVDLPGGRTLHGRAERIDADGRLVVDGTPVAAGDVVHARVT